MVLDYVLVHLAGQLGYEIPVRAVFGLLVTVWYLLNAMLSIVENAGRMGAPVPAWLPQYIAMLKRMIHEKGEPKREDTAKSSESKKTP